MAEVVAAFERLAVQKSEVTEVYNISRGLVAAFEGKKVLAFDSEGVSLSRTGKICVVQLGTRDHTYILDVMDKKEADPLMQWLKELLEDDEIVKIVHDCRMDSEALWHQKGIKLINVHDTSCWHNAITGEDERRTSLTNALRFYGLPCGIRDNSVYRTNPAFWARRPMTKQMVDRAAGDIDMLFKMANAQKKRATSSQAQQAAKASEMDSSETWTTHKQGTVSAGAAAFSSSGTSRSTNTARPTNASHSTKAVYCKYDEHESYNEYDDYADFGHNFEDFGDFSRFTDDNDYLIDKYGLEIALVLRGFD